MLIFLILAICSFVSMCTVLNIMLHATLFAIHAIHLTFITSPQLQAQSSAIGMSVFVYLSVCISQK